MTEDQSENVFDYIEHNEIAAFARLAAHLANRRSEGDEFERLRSAMNEAFDTVSRHTPVLDG